MTSRYAIVYYMTEWRPDIAKQLSVSLTSLDQLHLSSAEIKRYLVLAPSSDPQLHRFAKQKGVELVFKDRLTGSHPLPNKALIETSQPHKAVMYADLDTVFLKDPRDAFAKCAESNQFMARPDRLEPLYSWDIAPKPFRYFLKNVVGRWIWSRLQKSCLASADAYRIPYFNTGVFLCPGSALQELTRVWWSICSKLLKDRTRRHPYTFFFTFYFYEQLALALAVQKMNFRFGHLSSEYNFMPVGDSIDDLPDRYPVLCHLVTGVRSWYDLASTPPSNEYAELYSRVTDIIRTDTFPRLPGPR